MKSKKLIALLIVVTMLFTIAIPAFAENNKKECKGFEQFSDVRGYEWAFNEATVTIIKGIFKGIGYKLFAPGAKITRQEAAISAVRLIEKENEAKALSAAEIEEILKNVPDKNKISSWAKPYVAMLVKLGYYKANEKFKPQEHATRLDIAVLLVKALGKESLALESMNKPLSFKDAKKIPDNLKGYVYVATELQLIKGYNDKHFRPEQKVKRIEAAIMMGRADYLFEKFKNKTDDNDCGNNTIEKNLWGTVAALSAATSTTPATVTMYGTAYKVAADAVITIDSAAASFADLRIGDTASLQIKNNYVKRITVSRISTTINGTITKTTAATNTSFAKITIGNVDYPLSANAVISLNGSISQLSNLRAGDSVVLTIANGLVNAAVATRTYTTSVGIISSLKAAGANSPAVITVGTANYTLAANAEIKLNGAAAQFSDLKVNDSVILTVGSGLVDKVEATRSQTTIQGSIFSLSAPISGNPAGTIGLVGVIYNSNGSSVMNTYPVTTAVQILINNQTSQFSGLLLGDNVVLTFVSDNLVKVEVTR